MFWSWMLKYSSFLITGVVSLIVGWLLDRLSTKTAKLIAYTSHPQWVTLAPNPGQDPIQPIGTFTLFLWNQGRAPARDVHVGHYLLPASNVFPDIPRQIIETPGGGRAIVFPMVPPKTLVTISYLYFGPGVAKEFISYVSSEEGSAKWIPVMLQRIWPKSYLSSIWVVFIIGVWTVLNIILSLIELLWRFYYVK
jgi:hypothetical protein